jgi:hypothetical protein
VTIILITIPFQILEKVVLRKKKVFSETNILLMDCLRLDQKSFNSNDPREYLLKNNFIGFLKEGHYLSQPPKKEKTSQ